MHSISYCKCLRSYSWQHVMDLSILSVFTIQTSIQESRVKILTHITDGFYCHFDCNTSCTLTLHCPPPICMFQVYPLSASILNNKQNSSSHSEYEEQGLGRCLDIEILDLSLALLTPITRMIVLCYTWDIGLRLTFSPNFS